MKKSPVIIHGPLLDHIMLMSGNFLYILACTKCLYQCFVHSRDFKNDFKTIPSFHNYVTKLCNNSVMSNNQCVGSTYCVPSSALSTLHIY